MCSFGPWQSGEGREREFNTPLMGSALKQQMYKRGAGFICAQSTVLFHSHYQLETDKLSSCSGTKCDVVRLSPIRRAASGRGRSRSSTPATCCCLEPTAVLWFSARCQHT